jgi:hypothetical protein
VRFCDAEVPDPVGAIIVGLLCSGRDPGPSTAPTASFTANPGTVPNGGTVRLDASASSDAESKVVRYEWDFDAFPLDFEVDGGDKPVIERQLFLFSISGPEQREIGLRVTDQGGNTGTAERTVTITDPGFTAAFTVSPPAPYVGESAHFDGSSSTGAQTYSWDLDGDGAFEIAASASPTAIHVYQTPGERIVKLQIGDALGRTTVAQRAINVRGGVTTLRGIEARGRLVAPARRLGALRPFRRARWVARLSFSAEDGDSRLRGVALARFPRGRGKACLRIAMATRDRGRPAGRVTVLGGTGKAARLRGGGRFTFAFDEDTPRLNGRLRARLGRPRPLPRACAGL